MDPHKLLGMFVGWLETLPDRPFMLFLFIAASGILFLPLSWALKKLATMMAGLTGRAVGAPSEEETARLGAQLYGGADKDGRIEGIPTSFINQPVLHKSSVVGHEAEFSYTVRNPLGIEIRIHRAGVLHRPLEALPPEAGNTPESIKAQGYTLRYSPPEQAEAAFKGAATLGIFAATGDLEEVVLKGNELKASLYSKEDWDDETLGMLLKSGAEAAKFFD